MARWALALVLLLFPPCIATDSCDHDASELLQRTAAGSNLVTDDLDLPELAQTLLDLKRECRNASSGCLRLMKSVRSMVWPRVNALTGLPQRDAVEVTAFRGDVVHSELTGKCHDRPHTMDFVHIWKSAGRSCMQNLQQISRSWTHLRRNATFCKMIDDAHREERSLFTFVREPLARFLSGYNEIDRSSSEQRHLNWLEEFPQGSEARARSFLEKFFTNGIHRNGQMISQLEFLVPSELSCPLKLDFIGKVEELPSAWGHFMRSRGCEEVPFQASQSMAELSGEKTEAHRSGESSLRSLLSGQRGFLRGFCWMSLPDYVTFEYDLPPECLEPDADLRELVSLLRSAGTGGRILRPTQRRGTALSQVAAVRSKQAPKVFVGITSAYEERRKIWREDWKCGEQLTAAGIPYKFIVGWPVDRKRDLTEHRQGGKASETEYQKALALRNESKTFGDVHFVHLPDTYLDLSAKTFALMDYGYGLGATYVVKLDDDTCLNGQKLLEAIQEHETKAQAGGPKALYAGYYRFNGTEYRSMRGRDGSVHPYFSGPCYMLSKDLIQDIVQDDEMNSVLWATYGTFDEDAETGRWVAFAEEQHHIQVDKMPMKQILLHMQGKAQIPGSEALKQAQEFYLSKSQGRKMPGMV